MNRKVKKYIYESDHLSAIKKKQPDNLVILSASYEDRCLAVAKSFTESYRCESALIFYNKEFLGRGKTKQNLEKLCKTAANFSTSLTKIETSINDPVSIITEIHKYFSENSIDLDFKNISIDITTFPRQELFLLLRYIRMQCPNSRIRIFYTRPKKYGEWLSYGVKEVVAVPSFGGTQIPGRKKLLIILSGFEVERMFRLWEEHEPSVTILVIGDPPTDDTFLAINKVKANLLVNRANVILEKASADNPFNFFKSLEKILLKYKRDYNIFISPMSTKIQSVGLFLLFEKYNWLQISLAVPNDYNVDHYSKDAKMIYEFYLNQEIK